MPLKSPWLSMPVEEPKKPEDKKKKKDDEDEFTIAHPPASVTGIN